MTTRRRDSRRWLICRRLPCSYESRSKRTFHLLTAIMLLTCFRFSILLCLSVTIAEGLCERTLMLTSMGLHQLRDRSASLHASVNYR